MIVTRDTPTGRSMHCPICATMRPTYRVGHGNSAPEGSICCAYCSRVLIVAPHTYVASAMGCARCIHPQSHSCHSTDRVEVGVPVQYCGHNGLFMADLYFIAGAVVVRASGPLDLGALIRPPANARYHLTDHPSTGFWRPELGVFVVPAEQLKVLS